MRSNLVLGILFLNIGLALAIKQDPPIIPTSCISVPRGAASTDGGRTLTVRPPKRDEKITITVGTPPAPTPSNADVLPFCSELLQSETSTSTVVITVTITRSSSSKAESTFVTKTTTVPSTITITETVTTTQGFTTKVSVIPTTIKVTETIRTTRSFTNTASAIPSTVSVTETITTTLWMTLTTTPTFQPIPTTPSSTSPSASPTSTTLLCPTPVPGTNSTCALAGWGYATNNIYSGSPISADNCHQLCLQKPECASFQITANTTDPVPQCNLYKVTAGGNNTIPGSASPYLFFDRDCRDYLPAKCKSGTKVTQPKVGVAEAKALPTPSLFSGLSGDAVSDACRCILAAQPSNGKAFFR
ncbi:hypothetical protein BGZ60DRAFT_402726 [Tricladium varicosporioides]|nr:hypothetical protein BGZ60DRAFT_402726 [Hymenoscyphus varicosporioides]